MKKPPNAIMEETSISTSRVLMLSCPKRRDPKTFKSDLNSIIEESWLQINKGLMLSWWWPYGDDLNAIMNEGSSMSWRTTLTQSKEGHTLEIRSLFRSQIRALCSKRRIPSHCPKGDLYTQQGEAYIRCQWMLQKETVVVSHTVRHSPNVRISLSRSQGCIYSVRTGLLYATYMLLIHYPTSQ